MKELWNDVSGYADYYQVSNYGRIRSVSRFVRHPKGGLRTIKGMILKPQVTINGYCMISLSREAIRKYHTIHRLVALAFINNYEKKPTINHKNGIKTDNAITNLEWNTQSENCQHAYDTGLAKIWNKGVIGYVSKRSNTVIKMDQLNNVIAKYTTISNAKRETGINHISSCCHKKRKTAGGYKWKFNYDS